MLRDRYYPESLWRCGGAEIRADGIPGTEILTAVDDFLKEKQRRNHPGLTVLTLRLRRDGGSWEDENAGMREDIWRTVAAAAHHPDFVDIEIESAPHLSLETWKALRDAKIGILMSHHAFAPEDPAVWERYLAAMREYHPEAVKFAVWPSDRAALIALLQFTRLVAAAFPLSCVLGMGQVGRPTRLAGPLRGCPIAYGYLENGPVAPGQISADQLRNVFSRYENGPGSDKLVEEWINWADERLGALHAA